MREFNLTGLEDHERQDKTEWSRRSLKMKQFELRENAILDVANDLLMTKGFTKSTLEEVISLVGISKPTFYLHFKSKEDLYLAVMRRSMKEARETILEFERSLSPENGLRATIDWTLAKRFQEMNSCYFDLPGVLSILSAESLASIKTELLMALTRIIERAQSVGSANPAVTPVLLAQILMSIFKDAGYQEIIDAKLIDQEKLREGMINLLMIPKDSFVR